MYEPRARCIVASVGREVSMRNETVPASRILDTTQIVVGSRLLPPSM
jgi:hypothetical protein